MINKLLTENEIIQNCDKFNIKTAVYFLILNRRVVYVGQSTNVMKRINEQNLSKDFDSIKILECEKENLNIIESLYIHSIRPDLNERNKDGFMCAPLSLQEALNKLNAIENLESIESKRINCTGHIDDKFHEMKILYNIAKSSYKGTNVKCPWCKDSF